MVIVKFKKRKYKEWIFNWFCNIQYEINVDYIYLRAFLIKIFWTISKLDSKLGSILMENVIKRANILNIWRFILNKKNCNTFERKIYAEHESITKRRKIIKSLKVLLNVVLEEGYYDTAVKSLGSGIWLYMLKCKLCFLEPGSPPLGP